MWWKETQAGKSPRNNGVKGRAKTRWDRVGERSHRFFCKRDSMSLAEEDLK
jgi:hypothetical protein